MLSLVSQFSVCVNTTPFHIPYLEDAGAVKAAKHSHKEVGVSMCASVHLCYRERSCPAPSPLGKFRHPHVSLIMMSSLMAIYSGLVWRTENSEKRLLSCLPLIEQATICVTAQPFDVLQTTSAQLNHCSSLFLNELHSVHCL